MPWSGTGPTFYTQPLKHSHLTFAVRYHLPEFYRRCCRRSAGVKFMCPLNTISLPPSHPPAVPLQHTPLLASISQGCECPFPRFIMPHPRPSQPFHSASLNTQLSRMRFPGRCVAFLTTPSPSLAKLCYFCTSFTNPNTFHALATHPSLPFPTHPSLSSCGVYK